MPGEQRADRRDGRGGVTLESVGELGERLLTGSERTDMETGQTGNSTAQPRYQACSDQRRLSRAGRSDDVDRAIPAP